MAAEGGLAGLVLAGGRSTRMQRDKAALPFGGETQLARAVRLVGRHAPETFVSVRADQTTEAERARWPQVIDRLADAGPVAGILAALETRPDRAWLVVAVDLPLLDAATLEHLIALRDPTALATAYRSSEDGLPEPLCAIWEARSREPLAAYVAGGHSCPRKFLLTHPARLLDLAVPGALANVNTPADYAAALAAADGTAP
ncbi:MAG TPA: NTP transferase domain-containing protein [Steroidobacteraceae bacterium]|nr:NTP transferase domain-containing protein [Steroidobacteraceae bacterium]